MKKFLLNTPNISKLEKKYINSAINLNWLSSSGFNTKIFEKKFSKFTNRKFSLAVQSGTAALHATLKGLGVKKNDKVITPIYSCVASISSITQCGAIPVAVDVERETLGLDLELVKKAIRLHKPKVLQLVHVYGYPAKHSLEIIKFCKKNKVLVIEDGSESLGAKIANLKVGQMGDVSIFSIRSEKMIGVGEGGVISTNNKYFFKNITLFCSRSAPFRKKKDPYWKKYYSTGEGYNYLMPHLLGSLARAQIERFSKYILKEKIRVGQLYRKIFKDNSEFGLTQNILKGSKSSFWLNSLYFKKITNKKLILLGKELEKKNIEIRSGFWPLSHLKGFKSIILENGTSMNIFKKTIVLPSDWSLSENDIKYIYNTVISLLKKFSK